MGFFLPPKNLRNPEMLVGRKPIGPVVVDTGNAFGKHLKAGWLCDELGILHDVTGRYPATYNHTTALSYAATPGGRGLDFSGSTSNAFRYNIDSAALRDVFNGSRPFTLLIRADASKYRTSSCIFSLDGTDDLVVYIGDGTARAFRVFWRDLGGLILDGGNDFTREWGWFAYTFDGNSAHELFIDGISVDTATQSGAGAGPYSSGPAIGAWAGSATQYFASSLESVFIFTSDLSSVMPAITRNPYQILKPTGT